MKAHTRWRERAGAIKDAFSLWLNQNTADAERIRRTPLVEAALAAFPDAEFVDETEGPKAERNWSRH